MEDLSLLVNGVRYPVVVHIETRRTVRASIGRKGVTIRIPAHLRAPERRQHVERLMAWATRRLSKRPVRAYADGQTLVAWGTRYLLRFSGGSAVTSGARAVGGEIRIRLAAGMPEDELPGVVAGLLSRCLAREHRGPLERRLEELNRLHFRVTLGRVTLRHTRTTWGSCSARGNLGFSTRLLLAPPEIVDYVLVHELAHRIVPNHSAAFWALVRRALPDCEERRRWLRRHGHELEF